MNLVLRPLDNINDPTWSVIISLVILLFFVAFNIYIIMKLAFEELEDGSDDTPESEELLQFPSDENK
tara:strand:+ start:159 stop:359 length:201 start_codon:yes stop_codon:yes gene_type:complete